MEAVMLWETGVLRMPWLFFQKMRQVKGKKRNNRLRNNCDTQIRNLGGVSKIPSYSFPLLVLIFMTVLACAQTEVVVQGWFFKKKKSSPFLNFPTQPFSLLSGSW